MFGCVYVGCHGGIFGGGGGCGGIFGGGCECIMMSCGMWGGVVGVGLSWDIVLEIALLFQCLKRLFVGGAFLFFGSSFIVIMIFLNLLGFAPFCILNCLCSFHW